MIRIQGFLQIRDQKMSGFAQVAPCGYDDWCRVEADEQGQEQAEVYARDCLQRNASASLKIGFLWKADNSCKINANHHAEAL